MSEETESYGISIAGLDMVENTLGKDDPKSFFEQMCFDRPDLARKLEYWCGYINSEKGHIGVRDIIYDLLQHIIDQFVDSDSSTQSKIKEKTK